MRPAVRTLALTTAALVGFAANSLLCRAALGPGRIDAVSFTSVRVLSGALVLLALARERPRSLFTAGDWPAAAALFAYAAAFSLSYVRIGAGVGALLLFGAVQVTMLGWALSRGERPRAAEWAGILLALCGLAALLWRGLTAPDPVGAGLMLAAGAAWGVYSLRGRSAVRPLGTTAANFARAVAFCVLLQALAPGAARFTTHGALLAVVSGAIASGLGYSLWYAALPSLTATRAAAVQLSVPFLAAAGAVLFLGEPMTARLALSAAAILGGLALALWSRSAT